ncbi:MAG: VWA domain-containing protein [Chitinispirillaceae bacterium]|nr:VWA domain-containing protein [Chitinispirillaceae bacterium]
MDNITVIFTICLFAFVFRAPAVEKHDPPDDNLIQIAILLDASNSMDGLIDQAKTQLWKIVNELALAKRNGKAPRLEVAFYEYGKSSLPQRSGYIRQIVPLATDLDRISDELFKLTTNGGDEYCGQAISRALSELSWNSSSRVMKAIFIAGNEPFTQGEVSYAEICKKSIASGIVVNTIFCGSKREGIDSKWKDGADLTDGSYLAIDQNRKVADIAAPQDSAIMVLGQKLNATYVGYGSAGTARKSMQVQQDKMALSAAPATMVQRSIAKSSSHYDNAGWDLVDAKKEKRINLAELEATALPDEMKKMSVKEREAFIDTKSRERAELQAAINKLNEERRNYVAAHEAKSPGNATLDKAIVTAVRKLATGKGYRFETK